MLRLLQDGTGGPMSGGVEGVEPSVRRRRHRQARLALLLLCASTATACGARWTDEQRAALEAGPAVQLDRTADATAAGPSRSAARTVGAEGTPVPTGVDTGAAAPVADGAAPTAVAGDTDAAAEPAALACSAPSDAPGVTDDAIEVLSISALSGPVPGLGASAAAATRSHIAYRNATGGVCGRQIVQREADDGTDAGRYRRIVQEHADRVLGIAGGFTVGDYGAADVLRSTGMPVVNVISSDELLAVPTIFDVNPPYDDPAAVNAKYRFLHEQGARRVAFVYIAVDQSRQLVARERAQLELAGLEVVLVRELPLSTLSYDSAAQAVANSGADYMIFISSVDGNSSMARSMHGVDHDVVYPEYYSFAYGSGFVEGAGAEAAEGAVTWLRTRPLSDAGTNPEVAAFTEWMDRTAPGSVQDQYAADAWVGTRAFFDALERIPGPITREAFVGALRSTDLYDARGMMGGIHLGRNLTRGCLIGLRYTAGDWQRITPGQDFLC